MKTRYSYQIGPLSTIILGAAVILIACLIAMAIPTPGYTADVKVYDFIVDSDNMVTKLDKNNNEYTRFIVQLTQKVQGHEYTSGYPFMAFGELNEQAKLFQHGEKASVIAQKRTYNGRDSYTILKFLMNDE